MTKKKLLQILDRKEPDVLALYKARIQSSKQWQAFLKKDYTMIVDNPVVVLYVNKGLIPQGSNWKIDLLRNLDL